MDAIKSLISHALERNAQAAAAEKAAATNQDLHAKINTQPPVFNETGGFYVLL